MEYLILIGICYIIYDGFDKLRWVVKNEKYSTFDPKKILFFEDGKARFRGKKIK